ncbi:MFS transporter [Marmoricola sp. URHB0036]|uniref:MFS transporter n=1 Tax=Marmoricola sp. URHB0036 TaxID=1298863 RepID=UPI000407E9EE|nr:MFS transporter [Marmoricola sp. URHB0036]
MTMTQPDVAPRAFDEQHRTVTVGLLALVTMFAFEAVAVSLAMPSVARDLGGETLYPIAVIGMLTAAIVGMVVGGIWGDARGASLPVTLGGVGFVAGLLLSGFAGSMEVLVAGRLLQGLGGGAALTGLYVAVADGYPAHLRTRVFSLFATAWVVPSIAGPFVAGALVDLFGWRSVFLVVAGFAALSILAVRRPMSRRLAVRSEPLVWGRRPLYAVVAAVGVVALHLAGHGSGLRSAALLVAGLLVVTLAAGPLLPRGTTRATRGLPAVIASRGLFGAAFACVELFLPLVLQVEAGMSPTLSGLVMMVGALGWVAGSAYAGKRGEPETFPRIMRVGSLSLLVGTLISLTLVPLDHLPVIAGVVATIGFATMAVGMGLATPLMSTLALDMAPEGRQGDSGAAIQMSDSLGQSIAAGLVGAVFARWFLIDEHTSYLAGFGMAVLLALVAMITARRTTQNG